MGKVEEGVAVNIEPAQRILGFMNDAELLWLAKEASRHTRIVEVGSWRGRSTKVLADHTPGCVRAIDTWDGRDNDCLYEEVMNNGSEWLWTEFQNNLHDLIGRKVFPVKAESVAAADYFRKAGETFDMVFIDASHGYQFVKADILAWAPLVREGGLLCGHDFADRCHGVMRAVIELVPDLCLMEDSGDERSIWWKP